MAFSLPRLCLAALTIFSSGAFAATRATTANIESRGLPAGFSELARSHEVLVDVYFGGRKVGETRVIARPGYVKFQDPAAVLALIPNLDTSMTAALPMEAEFPSNAALVCRDEMSRNCGIISPESAGIIYDEEHFRVDVFVNKKWLQVVRPTEETYLPAPTAPLSLTTSAGLALSGSSDSSALFNFQNRTIVALHNGRIRLDSTYASKQGLVLDRMVGEVDRPGLRYSAGLFWAPGVDLVGQRRILGAGIATQFDTRADREEVGGTPLVVFLDQPSRVEILVDGRLVESGTYEAGNNLLDTSSLAAGAYTVQIRIHGTSGVVREEQRFFVKNPRIAPEGQPIYYAYVGMLANTRPSQLVSVSKDLFYHIGTARRISSRIAVDVSVIGTTHRPILNAGAWFMTPLARVRVSGLVSSRGDRGALVQAMSGNTGRLNLNFDLRRIWSHDGAPLIPLSNYVDSFDSAPLDGRLIGSGSYTQISGSLGYRLGAAYLAVIGSLRKNRGQPIDYSVGPNINWSMLSANGFQIGLQASGELTRDKTSGYVGFRMFYASRKYSLTSTAGLRGASDRGGANGSTSRAVGDATASMAFGGGGVDGGLAVGMTREVNSTTAHAQGTVYSHFGSGRGEIVREFEGKSRTQYGVSFQTGVALNRDDAIFGGRNLDESGFIISIDGGPRDGEFDVLIDGQARGRLKAGGRLPIFLQPYKSYSIRLRAVEAASVWYDSAEREFTLYPGNVERVRWHVERLLTVFGKAVRPDGTPVAQATISSRRGIGQSNADGYFQIETSANETLAFKSGNANECVVKIENGHQNRDYLSLGKVVCR